MIPRSSTGPAHTAAHGLRLPTSWYAVLACGLLIGTGIAWATRFGDDASGGNAPDGRPVAAMADCRGRQDTLRLDSLPWPLDSAQAVRRATLALQGASSLELPVRVTRYERAPAYVRLTVAVDVEPRVVSVCGSGRVAVHANGVTVVEERVTAARAPGR